MQTLFDKIMELEVGIEASSSVPFKGIHRDSSFPTARTGVQLLENEIHAPVYTSSSNIELVKKFKDLILFYPQVPILQKIGSRKIQIQRIENGAGNLNLDYYPVEILEFPTLNGKRFSALEFIEYIRVNLNYFIDTFYSEFSPFETKDNIWYSKNPEGAVIEIDISGPDNAAVVVGKYNSYYWIFSTVDTSNMPTKNVGNHPINGNRQFGMDYINGKYRFFTRAADRYNSVLEVASQRLIKSAQQKLWESLQNKVAQFINKYGGRATAYQPVIKEINYSNALNIINTL